MQADTFIKEDCMKVLIVGDTDRWRNAVKGALPTGCDICICLDEVAALSTQADDNNDFDLVVLANHLSNSNDGIKILREARAEGEKTPIIIYSDCVDAEAESEIIQLQGTYISPSDDGVDFLAHTARRILNQT